jgi:hypothetical protein
MLRGLFEFWLYDRNGKLKRQWTAKNGVTYEGANYVLSTVFCQGQQLKQWNIGLIDGTAPAVLSPDDTAAEIGGDNGWTENAAYSGSRPPWAPVRVDGLNAFTDTPQAFSIDSDGELYGAFIVDSASNVLYCTAEFQGGAVSVSNGESIYVKYALSIDPEPPGTVTTQGAVLLLSCSFAGATPPKQWFVGLILNGGSTSQEDVGTNHPGWQEPNPQLVGRLIWATSPNIPPANGTLTAPTYSQSPNQYIPSTPSPFFYAGGTQVIISGAFLTISPNQQLDVTGTVIYCSAMFPNQRTLSYRQPLNLNYTINLIPE